MHDENNNMLEAWAKSYQDFFVYNFIKIVRPACPLYDPMVNITVLEGEFQDALDNAGSIDPYYVSNAKDRCDKIEKDAVSVLRQLYWKKISSAVTRYMSTLPPYYVLENILPRVRSLFEGYCGFASSLPENRDYDYSSYFGQIRWRCPVVDRLNAFKEAGQNIKKELMGLEGSLKHLNFRRGEFCVRRDANGEPIDTIPQDVLSDIRSEFFEESGKRKINIFSESSTDYLDPAENLLVTQEEDPGLYSVASIIIDDSSKAVGIHKYYWLLEESLPPILVKLGYVHLPHDPRHEQTHCCSLKLLRIKYDALIKFVEDKNNALPIVLEKIGNFIYFYINIMPYLRGSAAIGEWIMRGIAMSRGIELGAFAVDNTLSWDFLAFTQPSARHYAKRFHECFQRITMPTSSFNSVVSFYGSTSSATSGSSGNQDAPGEQSIKSAP